jgi:hypothetical protein
MCRAPERTSLVAVAAEGISVALVDQAAVVQVDRMAEVALDRMAEVGLDQMAAVLGQRAVAGAYPGADHSLESQGSSPGLQGWRERLEE